MFFIRKLKAHFAQGENNKRHKVLKAIVEAVRDEYTEDNYISRMSWLVGELFRNDPERWNGDVRCLNDIEKLKKAIGNEIEAVYKGETTNV